MTPHKLLHLAEPRFPLLREEREANAASPARPAGCTGLSPRQRFTNRSGTTAATGVRKARDTPVVFTIKKFRLSHGVTAACSQRQGARTRRSTNWFPKKGFRCSSQEGMERRRVANGDPAARGPPSPAPAPCGAGRRFLGRGSQGRWDAQGMHTASNAHRGFTDEQFQPRTRNEIFYHTAASRKKRI